MKKLVAIGILAVFVSVLLCGGNQLAQAKTYRLRAVAGHPYAAAVWVQGFKDFFTKEVSKRVASRTSDKVEFQHLYGGSVAKLGEVLESVESGIADIGVVMAIFENSKMYLFTYTWWPPFSATDMKTVLTAHHKVLKKYDIFDKIMAKYNQKVLAWIPVDSQQMITKFPVHTLKDIHGKKIANGGPLLPWLKALGCVGVQSRLNEGYTSLATGVYEGWVTSGNPIIGFRLYEPAPYFTNVGFGAFLAGTININNNTWKKLPPAVQKIMLEVGKEYEIKLAELTQKQLNDRFSKIIKAGVKAYNLPEKEKARWAKVLNDAHVAQMTAKQADERGWPGTKILNDYYKALAEIGYKFPYTPNNIAVLSLLAK